MIDYDVSMRRVACALVMVAAAAMLHAKDFPEPFLALDGLASSIGPAEGCLGIAPGMGASFEYGNYALSHDDVDSFYLAVDASPVILRLGDRLAIGGSFGSWLQCGPVPAGDMAANIAAFWMNSVQFEYALRATVAPFRGGAAGPRLLAEYGRTSQHPLMPRFSEVAADILCLGFSLPPLRAGRTEFLACARLCRHDLFDFWQSTLPPPRVSWLLYPQLQVEYEASRGMACVARLYPRLFWDRYAGGPDAELFAEAGLSLGRDRERLELLLVLYATRDSEMLDGKAHPTLEAGFALRTSHDRAEPRR